MVLIQDEEYLEILQCSRCHKYLSVFPVKNHSNRDVTCGRCSGVDDDGGVRSVLYELVAREYLFRCVNRYEGCRKLLRADETEAHERECIGKVFNCPKCEDGIEFSILELIWHYKLKHPSSCLKKNSIEGVPLNDDIMLYVQDEVVFFIIVACTGVSNIFFLSAATLTEVDVTQAFSIIEGSHFQRTEKKPCKTLSRFNRNFFSIEANSAKSVEVIINLEVSNIGKLYEISIPSQSKGATAEVMCVDRNRFKEGSAASVSNAETYKIQLSKEFENNYCGYKLNGSGTALLGNNKHKIDLTCSNCKQLIGLPLFLCKSRKHKICYNCRTWCGICDKSVREIEPSNPLYVMISHLKFPCKWKCGEYFTSNLRTHENSCKLGKIKCPKCSFEMSLLVLKIHLQYDHNSHLLDYDSEGFGKTIMKNFVLNSKCCYIHLDNCQDQCYDLNFSLYDNESFMKLGLVHNGTCSYNIIPHVPSNTFNLYVPYINFNYKE